MEPVDIDVSIKFYLDACSMYEEEDRPRMAIDTFRRTINFLVKHKR